MRPARRCDRLARSDKNAKYLGQFSGFLNPDGTVDDATIVRDVTTGSNDVDQIIMKCIRNWRYTKCASGWMTWSVKMGSGEFHVDVSELRISADRLAKASYLGMFEGLRDSRLITERH